MNNRTLFGNLFNELAMEKGKIFYDLFNTKADQSQIPGNLSPEIKNLVGHVGDVDRGKSLSRSVKEVFKLTLSELDASYFLMYIGTIYTIKRHRKMSKDFIDVRHRLTTAAFEGHLSLIEISSRLGIPATKEALLESLRDFPKELNFLKEESRILVETLGKIEDTSTQTEQLEVEARENLIICIGLAALKYEFVPNRAEVEKLAENYFKGQIMVAFYHPN